MLRSADQLVAAVESAYSALFGDENRDGCLPAFWQRPEVELDRVSDLSGELSQLSETVNELRYTAEDAAERPAGGAEMPLTFPPKSWTMWRAA